MASEGKSVRYRTGQGSHHVNRWTTFRPGPLHEQTNKARDDMFVDVTPYASLAGFNTERDLHRRASTHIDQHAIARTRGTALRAPTPDRYREHPVAKHGGGKKEHD